MTSLESLPRHRALTADALRAPPRYSGATVLLWRHRATLAPPCYSGATVLLWRHRATLALPYSSLLCPRPTLWRHLSPRGLDCAAASPSVRSAFQPGRGWRGGEEGEGRRFEGEHQSNWGESRAPWRCAGDGAPERCVLLARARSSHIRVAGWWLRRH